MFKPVSGRVKVRVPSSHQPPTTKMSEWDSKCANVIALEVRELTDIKKGKNGNIVRRHWTNARQNPAGQMPNPVSPYLMFGTWISWNLNGFPSALLPETYISLLACLHPHTGVRISNTSTKQKKWTESDVWLFISKSTSVVYLLQQGWTI